METHKYAYIHANECASRILEWLDRNNARHDTSRHDSYESTTTTTTVEKETPVSSVVQRHNPTSRLMDIFQLTVLQQDTKQIEHVVGGSFDLPEKKHPERTFVAFGKTVRIEQGCSDISRGHSELIWSASMKLPEFFERNAAKIDLRGKRVLELGSGTGTCGICVAAAGAHVTLTDQVRALPLLQKNRDTNAAQLSGSLSVRPLYWGFEPHHRDLPPFDVVLASDCLYSDAAWNGFQDTLYVVLRKNPRCVAYVCNDGRWDIRFFDSLRKRGFIYTCLDANAVPMELPSSISSRLLFVRVELRGADDGA